MIRALFSPSQWSASMQVAFYEAFAFNPSTGDDDIWFGTAPLATIRKHGLKADLSYPLYGDATLCVEGWGYKSGAAREAGL
jgi:hypothetical protein